MLDNKILIFLSVISSLLLAANCDNNWCPCLEPTNSHQNVSKHVITESKCQKYKGFFVSEERDIKCECCLILRKNKESCKPTKRSMFVVKCEEGLHCDHKNICRVNENKHSIVVVLKSPHSNDEISSSFKRSFAEMLRNMFSCDCSHEKCNNEMTRMECEEHQGLFVDKLSVRNRCQCCDKCYIPRGQHQKCAHSYNKDIQFVCDTGLYCSPFTHMCIEKREILSQFMKKVRNENIDKERAGVFEQEEDEPAHNVLILHRAKRMSSPGEEEDKPLKQAPPDEPSTTEGEHSTTVGDHTTKATKGKGKKDHHEGHHGVHGKHGKGKHHDKGKHPKKEGEGHKEGEHKEGEHKEGDGHVGARHGKGKHHHKGKHHEGGPKARNPDKKDDKDSKSTTTKKPKG